MYQLSYITMEHEGSGGRMLRVEVTVSNVSVSQRVARTASPQETASRLPAYTLIGYDLHYRILRIDQSEWTLRELRP